MHILPLSTVVLADLRRYVRRMTAHAQFLQWLYASEWPLQFNLHYQSSTNPSENIRDRGRRQHETSECREQIARPLDNKRVISDSKDQSNATTVTCLAVSLACSLCWLQKRVTSVIEDYRLGDNQTTRQGDEKRVFSDNHKPGDNLIGRFGIMKPLKNYWRESTCNTR